MQTPSLQELLESGLHFGHQVKRWNPQMSRFIYGTRDNIHIIDLVKTREQLQKAAEFVKEQAAEGKVVLFVGTKRQAQDIIVEQAKKAGMPYMEKRWIGGLITNWEQIKRNIDKINRYEEEKRTGKLSQYTKKEQLLLERKIHKLVNELGGLTALNRLPDILFVIDPKKEANAVYEAGKKGMPVVALCDTNANPNDVDYPIPGNDDSIKGLQLVITTIAEAVAEGRQAYEKDGAAKAKKAEEPTADAVVEAPVINADEVIEAIVEEIEGVVREVEEQTIHNIKSDEQPEKDHDGTPRVKDIVAATAKTEEVTAEKAEVQATSKKAKVTTSPEATTTVEKPSSGVEAKKRDRAKKTS